MAVLSPDGQFIASVTMGSSVDVWECESGVILQILQGLDDNLVSVAWSSDRLRIACGLMDGTVKVWERYQAALPGTDT
jgi:WD40 repeat protein